MTSKTIRVRNRATKDIKRKFLLPDPLNWHTHPDGQRQALAALFAEVGFVGHLLVRPAAQRNRWYIVDGHERAEHFGPDDPVPCCILDVDADEAKKLLLSYDPLGYLGGVDEAALKTLQAEVEFATEGLEAEVSGALARLGELTADDADGADQVEEDDPPPPDAAAGLQKKWKTRRGQLWQIAGPSGNVHRLLCGDSTKEADVARVMDGAKAVLLATDPPYGVDFAGQKYNPRAKAWDGIEGDKRQGQQLQDWLTAAILLWVHFCTDDAAYYFWSAAKQEAWSLLAAAALHVQSQIVWVKNQFVLGQADYHWQHENCWYCYKKNGTKHRWFGGRKQSSVWSVDQVKHREYQHPTQKPVELSTRPLSNHTREGEVCFEPFAGSGPQYVAAEQLGRVCCGLEIEPKYCAVILERMTNLGCECREEGTKGQRGKETK